MTSGTIDPASKSHLPDFNAAAIVPGLSGRSICDATLGAFRISARPRISTPSPGSASSMRRIGSGRWKRCCAAAPGVMPNGSESPRSPATSWRASSTPRAPRGATTPLLNADTKAMLDAYARGVNAFIALGAGRSNTPSSTPKPAAWEPWHSIAVMRQIGFLMGSVWWKLWRAAALPIVGAAQISKAALRRRRRRPAVHSAGRGGRTLSRRARRSQARARGAARPPDRPGRRRTRRRQQQLGAVAVAHRDRPADAGRRSAPRAGNAEHVLRRRISPATSSTYRPHRARRAGLSAFRS